MAALTLLSLQLPRTSCPGTCGLGSLCEPLVIRAGPHPMVPASPLTAPLLGILPGSPSLRTFSMVTLHEPECMPGSDSHLGAGVSGRPS